MNKVMDKVADKKMWSEGLRFECQGSGKCCVSHGDYGHVFMTAEDRKRMAKVLGLKTAAFTKKYCEIKDGIWKLKDHESGDCLFLRDKRCSVYEGRPTQCRTWPFWPEVLEAKTWTTEVAAFCPGVGKGRVWTPEEIEVQLKDQIASESKYGS
jgi:Fe-S-cluster containining protein